MKKINSPDEAARLVIANQALAVSFAKRYRGHADWGDIIAACKNGLARAAKDYDSNKGAFSTYAWHWMRKHAEKAFKEYARLMISQNLGPSLNAPRIVDGEPRDDETLGEVIADGKAASPLEALEEKDSRELLWHAIKSAGLNRREEMIIVFRFGLDDQAPSRQNRIAKAMGVTPRRVRQLEKSAREKIFAALLKALRADLSS